MNSSSPKCVSCRNQGGVTTAHSQVGELSKGGGFSDTIHSHHQPDVQSIPFWGQKRNTTGLNRKLEEAPQLLLEETNALGRFNHLNIHALTEGIQDLISGLDTGIRPQQERFKIIQHFRCQGIVAKVVQQAGNEALTGLLHPAAQPPKPIDLLQRNLVDPSALSRQNFRRPKEILVQGAEAGLRGVLRSWRWRRLRFSRDSAIVLVLLSLLSLSSCLLKK